MAELVELEGIEPKQLRVFNHQTAKDAMQVSVPQWPWEVYLFF